jgi:hypothetical protein
MNCHAILFALPSSPQNLTQCPVEFALQGRFVALIMLDKCCIGGVRPKRMRQWPGVAEGEWSISPLVVRFRLDFRLVSKQPIARNHPTQLSAICLIHIQGRLLQEFAMNLPSRRATEESIRVASQQSTARPRHGECYERYVSVSIYRLAV